jgi:hypothetical protein
LRSLGAQRSCSLLLPQQRRSDTRSSGKVAARPTESPAQAGSKIDRSAAVPVPGSGTRCPDIRSTRSVASSRSQRWLPESSNPRWHRKPLKDSASQPARTVPERRSSHWQRAKEGVFSNAKMLKSAWNQASSSGRARLPMPSGSGSISGATPDQYARAGTTTFCGNQPRRRFAGLMAPRATDMRPIRRLAREVQRWPSAKVRKRCPATWVESFSQGHGAAVPLQHTKPAWC